MARNYKFVFRDFKETIQSCPLCGKMCSRMTDEFTVTNRKTTVYFHKLCFERSTKCHRDSH